MIAGIMVWRDITERKRIEEEHRANNITARKDMEEELEAKSNRLQEVNSALKALLRQRDEDRTEFEEAVVTNIENLIMPYVKRLKSGPLSSSQASLLEILESHLKNLPQSSARRWRLNTGSNAYRNAGRSPCERRKNQQRDRRPSVHI